jgi:hypothetical protein
MCCVLRTLQLDKLLVSRDWSRLKLSNFEQSRQLSRLLGATVRGGSDDERENITSSPPVRGMWRQRFAFTGGVTLWGAHA